MNEPEELSTRVTKLEAWVEAVMQTLSGMQVEPVLCELERAYKRKTIDTHEPGLRQ